MTQPPNELLNAILRKTNLTIKDLRPYLYKDESWNIPNCADPYFLLTRYGEAYLYSEENLRVFSILPQKRLQCHFRGSIFDVWGTDDGLCLFTTPIENTPLFLQLGAFKRRPHANGQFIKRMEERLAHRMFPYTP